MNTATDHSLNTDGDQQPLAQPLVEAGDAGEQQLCDTPAVDDKDSDCGGQERNERGEGSILRDVLDTLAELRKERQASRQRWAQWKADMERIRAGWPEGLRRSWNDHERRWEADPKGEWEKALRIVEQSQAREKAMAAAAAAEQGQEPTVPFETVHARL